MGRIAGDGYLAAQSDTKVFTHAQAKHCVVIESSS
jgi:hypothetical protein